MPTLLTADTAICADDPPWSPDEAQARRCRVPGPLQRPHPRGVPPRPALATSSGPPTNDLAVLAATRAHIEIYRSAMEQRGLAASTIDRRLSTVCGYYRFAHIDGRIASNPAQYVRRPKVAPDRQHADWIAASSACSCSPPSTTTAPTRRSPCCSASTVSACPRRARPTSRTSPSSVATGHCGSSARATSPPSSRWSRARRARSTSRSANATKARSCDAATANGSIVALRIAGCARSANEPDSATFIPTCCAPRSSWPPSTPASRYATFRLAARHADPRTTTIYDRRRQNFDRHAAYVVVAFVASG